MNRRSILTRSAALLLIALMTAAGAFLGYRNLLAPKTITAYFDSATAIYPGDQVRVAGVRVGTISSIEPQSDTTKMVLRVDRGVPIPADAKAVIVAQSLVAARYVQLTPAYESARPGPILGDGAVIPLERTAVPVEWDEVKVQLTRLATEVGPSDDAATGSVGRFVDSAANAMAGNGDKLRQTIKQLSGVARILADGRGDIVDIIENLQTVVTALRDSGEQIVQFENRFASLTSVLNDSRSTLDSALTTLSVAVSEVQTFVADNRDALTENIERLADSTQTLVDHRMDLEQVLHVAPTGMANFMNIYNPDQGTVAGSFVMNNFSNPLSFICAGIGAVANVTAAETGKLCAQYLGPALQAVNFNYLPFPVNPILGPTARPENLIYTEPHLVPGYSAPPPTDISDLMLPAEAPPAPEGDGPP